MAHILVVDDEPHIRFLIRKVLESVGHSIFEAGNAQAALDVIETHPDPFDAIVLDVRMPYMDGFEFLRILRGQAAYIPVIIVTAHGDLIPAAVEQEISGHLLKPFGRQKLIDMVSNAVVARSARTG
jgi:CheY-like chemotaxis protein